MTIAPFIPTTEMVFTTVGKDRQRLLTYCRGLKKTSSLTLDLGQVVLCDSAGLAFLIEAKRLARKYKKTCHIEGMSKSIYALAEFCGVEKILSGATHRPRRPAA